MPKRSGRAGGSGRPGGLGRPGGPGRPGGFRRIQAARLSHIDSRGRIKMVDVGGKPVTDREAIARGSIAMSREALRLVRTGAVKKGDPLQAARRSEEHTAELQSR